MSGNILVPLDGSNLAETVLPYVKQLAGALQWEVQLLRVVQAPEYKASEKAKGAKPSAAEDASKAADQYLKKIVQYFKGSGSTVISRVKAGVPATALLPTSASLDVAAAAARNWSSGELPSSELPFHDWSPQATVYFIKALPPDLSTGQLAELDELLGLSQSRNAEIARTWFTQVAARRHLPAYEKMRDYLGRYGRTRLVKPVYAALVANGEDAQWAKTRFDEVKANYHPLTVAEIERLIAPK